MPEAPAAPAPDDTHVSFEDQPWGVNLGGPASGPDSPAAVASQATAVRLATSMGDAYPYGGGPWEVHRGGVLWLKDESGWFFVRNLAGIEYGAQWIADPAKVDQLRVNARRVYALFPEAVRELGIRELLDTPITDAAGVARWVDSICNCSMPLPPALHSGLLPAGAGMDHYPQPVVDIQFFKRDDFQLWVTDPQSGRMVAVVPDDASGRAMRVIFAEPDTDLGRRQIAVERSGGRLVAAAGQPLAPSVVQENHPWGVRIPNHPGRTDSPAYIASRLLMHRLVAASRNYFYGSEPFQDHHGGSLWLYDRSGTFVVLNAFGMEWSSQFCADPAKVDRYARQSAARLYARSPQSAQRLGITALLTTPITDAQSLAAWVDSPCNAGVPLSAAAHVGVIPTGAGIHHYPAWVAQLSTLARAGTQLWVTDPQSQAQIAVAPTGDGPPAGRVAVLWAPPDTDLGRLHAQASALGKQLVLDADHPVTRAAFAVRDAPRLPGIDGLS